jgi:hypothetical protein
MRGLSVVLPPSDTEPPPERPVPAPTVSDGFDSMVLVTPLTQKVISVGRLAWR